MDIVVGTKKWSSWSMRPWLVLKRTGAPFTETLIRLRQGQGTFDDIAAHSPSQLVPALKDGELTIWDSLAICEHLNDSFPEARLWPEHPGARALARSAACEMHSGFAALRKECPMELGETLRVELSDAARTDIRRIVVLWRDLLGRFDGDFLCGGWSIADAFFTPVATRFRTYGVDLADYGDDGAAAAYAERLLATPEYQAWEADALS
jgi:glutathione S-transferase